MDSERPVIVQKEMVSVVVELPGDLTVSKSVDGRRVVSCTASTSAIDRVGDIVVAAGWQLGEYRKNPVVLLSHDHAAPVARAERVGVIGDALTAMIAFPDEGVAEKSHGNMAPDHGRRFEGNQCLILRPLRSTPMANGGQRYEQSELLEISIVSVGANPQALIQGSVPASTQPTSTRKLVSGRMLRLRREVAELRKTAPRRMDVAEAAMTEPRRAARPERAQALAVDAKAKGHKRLAAAATAFWKNAR